MKFIIRGNKVEVTEPIKQYIETKLGKLNKYFDDHENITANAVIKIRGIEQIVEITIPIKKIILRGEESNKDLYAAIDLVTDKIERQIRKNKTKLKRRTTVDRFDINKVFNYDTVNDEQTDDSSIVKRKTIDVKPMSEEEAILQMELLGHDFFVFKEAETLNTCVLYRRKDNNYGIITIN